MIDRFFAAVAGSVVRRRTVWVLCVVLVAFGLFWASSRLSLRLAVADFLPDESAVRDGLPPEVLKQLSGAGRLAVLMESDSATALDSQEVGEVFAYLTPRLARIDGVRGVHARLTVAETRYAEEYLPRRIILYFSPGALRVAGERLRADYMETVLLGEGTVGDTVRATSSLRRERDPLSLIRLAAATMQPWQGVSRVRLKDGYYTVPGEHIFFLTIESETTLDDIDSARSLVLSVESVLEGAEADVAIRPLLEGKRLSVVGRPISFVSAFDTLYRDVFRVAGAATIVVAILLGLFFRRPTAPLVLLVPVAFGLAATAAVAFVFFGSVSLIAWVFIGLIVGLGVDFGIHIAVHYWVYGRTDAGREEALESALKRPGKGIVLGGFTSAAAFVAIWTIPYPATREVAWLTAVGLLAIMISSLTVLPLLLSFSSPRAREEGAWGRWSSVFVRASRANPALSMLPWVLLVGACILVLPSLRFEPHPWKLAVRGNPESARLDRLSRELGSAFTPLLIVSRGGTVDEALQRDREAVRLLQRDALRAGVAHIQSLGRWLPAPDDQRANARFVRENGQLFSSERFRRDFEATVARMDEPNPYLSEEYLPLIARSLSTELEEITVDELRDLGLGDQVDRHLRRQGSEYVAVSYVFLRRFPWAEGVISRFVSVAREAGLYQLPGVTLVGEALRSATHTRVIRRAVVVATTLAILLVGALLWLRFRSLALVALCLAPLVCGLSAVLLLMRVLGIELNLLTITVAPVLVGIGVDDGIHMVERLRQRNDLPTVLRETGSSMTMTTLTTAGALACLVLATFAGVRELGLIGAVGLIVCLLASLHLIPAGWQLVHRTPFLSSLITTH